MKRDWELLRQQLTDIEEGRDVLAQIGDEPKWMDDLTEEEYIRILEEYRLIEERIAGHLELLVDAGYIIGLKVIRGADNSFHYSVAAPRLTMTGHDLLNTMRSNTMWQTIKSTAKIKGIELTFESIRALGAYALKQVIGS